MALLVDVAHVPFDGSMMPLLRVHSEQAEGAPYVLVLQVVENLILPNGISDRAWQRSLGNKMVINGESRKRQTSKAELRLYKELGVLQALCGGATMISADLAAAVLRALEVPQAEQFVQQVVEPPMNALASTTPQLKQAISGSSSVVMLPDQPTEYQFEVTPEMLQWTRYGVDAETLQQPRCRLLASQLEAFGKWLLAKVALSREGGAKVKDVTADDHKKRLCRMAGFLAKAKKQPLDIRLLGQGNSICAFSVFLLKRGEASSGQSSGENYSYVVLHLSSLSKLLGWLQVYEPSKAAAYQKLGQQVKNYKKQLDSNSKPERMDVPKLLRQGLAVCLTRKLSAAAIGSQMGC